MIMFNYTILGPVNCPVENRIISLIMRTGPSYPDAPPGIHFVSKLNYPFLVRLLAVHALVSPPAAAAAADGGCAALLVLTCLRAPPPALGARRTLLRDV